MSRILVTGGCGFIGANLAPRLRELRHEVVILDDLSAGSPAYLDDPGAYRVVRADVRDAAAMARAVDAVDTVVHLAASGAVVESVAAPAANFSVNVEGTFRVLEAARSAGVKRVIFASTGGAVLGEAAGPVDERTPAQPISPYGASKLAGEAYCSAFAHSYRMSITALRFANVIGPLSWHKTGAVSAFFKAILAGQPLRIYGDGAASRDFMYVEDLCRGILAALAAPLPGYSLFHLASGREVTVRELARAACVAAGVPQHAVSFEPRRAGEVERNVASFELARRVLQYQPEVALERAMALTWSWFRRYAPGPKA